MRKHGACERSFVEKWDVGRKILCNFMSIDVLYKFPEGRHVHSVRTLELQSQKYVSVLSCRTN